MNVQLIKGDITTLNVDALVNAANSSLSDDVGVDRAKCFLSFLRMQESK